MVTSPPSDIRVRRTYQEWKSCFSKYIENWSESKHANQLWKSFTGITAKCSKEGQMKNLKIIEIQNTDEKKYHKLPETIEQEPSVILTLGVGNDTEGEEKLRKMLPASSRFYGADPIIESNRDKYTKFGTFFPFAISSQGGMLQASVLLNGTYQDRTVANVDLAYFMKEIVKEDLYDDLWMDSEFAEFDLFRFFYKNAHLDQRGIIVCQWNVEVHKPTVATQTEQFHAFIYQMLQDEIYAVVRCKNVGHLRLFLINFRDKRCVDKYLKEVSE